MAYQVTDVAQVGGIKEMLTRINAKLKALDNKTDEVSFKALKVENNTVYFYSTSDTTQTAVAQFNFAEEIFLDQAGTTLVDNFSWSAVTYPNSTNPNLDGKTVLVLAVKGDKETNPTVKYSFVNMEELIDIYEASDTSIAISDYKVQVRISEVANNAITLKNDGLHVDVSGKVNKVSGATTGNVPVFTSDGSIANSTISGGDILTKAAAGSFTTDNIIIFGSDGKLADSGHAIATDAEFLEMLNEVMPTVSGSGT